MAMLRARAFGALSQLKSTLTFSPTPNPPLGIRRCSSTSLHSRLQKVGFIGIGNMGFHMANNLIKAGFDVIAHDINPNAIKVFSDRGVPTRETPFEVAESSDVIITMLPSSSHVLNVYTGANGLLHGENFLRPWLFIDSSTVDPHTSRKLSENVSKCVLKEKTGFTDVPFMLDAPVSGGVPGAEAGTLTFMVGGLEDAYIAAKPLFLSMGKHTIYCGGSGNGVVAKICNNLAMAISMVGVSEAFALGQSLGITAKTLTNIFNSSSARCWSSDTYNPVPGMISGVPSSRNYDGGFSSKLMAKDLELAVASAKEIGFRCPLTSQARDMRASFRPNLIVRISCRVKCATAENCNLLTRQHVYWKMLSPDGDLKIFHPGRFSSIIYTKLCEEGHELKDFSGVFRHYYKGKDEV